MRMSNAIHIYELIFLLLVECLAPGVAWSQGKYLSKYEYPEIPLLFSCKEESKEKEDVKPGFNRNVQSKYDFSISLDTKSMSPLRGEDRHIGSYEKLKPWMRGKFAEETKSDRESKNHNENYNYDKRNPAEEEEAIARNIPSGKNSMNEEDEKSLYQTDEKSRKLIISDEKDGLHNERENAAPFENRKHKQVKKTMRVKQKGQSQDKIIPFKEYNEDIKSRVIDSGRIPDSDFSNYQRRYSYPEETNVIPKRSKFKIKNNRNHKVYRDSLKYPEYEGNIQEYEELTNNKNAVVAINQNLPPDVTASHINVCFVMTSTAKMPDLKIQSSDSANCKLENSSLKNAQIVQVTLNPLREPPLPSAMTAKNVETFNDKRTFAGMSNSVLPLSLKEEPQVKAFSHKYSDMTPSFLLPIPEKDSMVTLNVSKTNEVVLGDMNMMEPSPKRGTSLQGNNLLLAKPPVKIANTLIEKHSDEDIENAGAEEHGTKVVKLMPMNPVTQPTTVIFAPKSSNHLSVVTNKKYQEHMAKNNGQQYVKNYNFHNNKRYIQDNKVAILPQYLEINKNLLEDENINDLKPNLDVDEASGIVNDKLTEPQFYSLSKGKTALARISSLFDKLKPNRSLKNTKAHQEKVNDSFKRSVPEIYEQEYNPGYDYYTNKGNRVSAPLQSYYDYDNEYGLDYSDGRDYPKISRFNNTTALTSENEAEEYGDVKNYRSKFPKMKKKLRKINLGKVEETYKDIFAHPISLDDPELQILRDDSVEFVNRRLQHKNQHKGSKRRKVNADRNAELFRQDHPMEPDPGTRSHLRNKRGEFAAHRRHNIAPVVQEPEPITDDETGKKISHI